MECGTEIKVLWYREWNPTQTAVRNKIWPTGNSNEMFASRVNPIKTPAINGMKRPKICPWETTPYRDCLSTLITLRERETWGKVVAETWTKCHILVSETPHNPAKCQRTSSLVREHEWKESGFRGLSALLIGYKAERPGKYYSKYHPFHWGAQFHCVYGPGRIQHIEPRNEVWE